MVRTRGFWNRVFVLALAEGAAFWAANFGISLTPVAAEYRAGLSIPYVPMLVASLVGGLFIGLCVSCGLLRFSRAAPGRYPVRQAMLLSLAVLVIVTVALEIPARFAAGTGGAVRYFLIGLLINTVRILVLGFVIGHLQAWLDRRECALAQRPAR